MITGNVGSNLLPHICLYIEDDNGQTHAIDADIDTGFTGFLCLPPSLVATLGLAWRDDRDVQLADGNIIRLNIYSAVVVWDNQPRHVEIHAANSTPVVGVKLLEGSELRIRFVNGGLVWIDVIP
jgi:clan AA aspartic protease